MTDDDLNRLATLLYAAIRTHLPHLPESRDVYVGRSVDLAMGVDVLPTVTVSLGLRDLLPPDVLHADSVPDWVEMGVES